MSACLSSGSQIRFDIFSNLAANDLALFRYRCYRRKVHHCRVKILDLLVLDCERAELDLDGVIFVNRWVERLAEVQILGKCTCLSPAAIWAHNEDD
jgi:hypothetical protein